MKHHLLITGMTSLLLWGTMATAQQGKPFRCGSTEVLMQDLKNHPTLIQDHQQSIQDALTMPGGTAAKSTSAVSNYTIPVVFHIIHLNGPENISDAQIHDAIAILNRDYNKLNADTSTVTSPFDTLIGNPNITFKLAQRDYHGNCTNGIERIYSSQTNMGNDNAKLSPWPQQNYLNIWVVNQMESGLAGYSRYPSQVANAVLFKYDGVIILHNYVGSIGTSNPFTSRALTHEIGHYLNLPHTWGDNNAAEVACGDDGILDTPPTRGHLFDPAKPYCQQVLPLCNAPAPENIENYMEYAYCQKMFTRDQVTVMRAALASAVANRSNLWNTANLIATGVLNPQPCAPIANFYTSKKMICSGANSSFIDNSTNGTVSSYQWYFPTGTPSVSTLASPVVTFTSFGWQPAALVVTNAQGTDSIYKAQAVFVSHPGTGADIGPELTFQEGFETAGMNAKWLLGNPDNDGYAWSFTSATGRNSPSSIYMQNDPLNYQGNVDYFVSPSIDMTKYVSAIFNYDWAFATRAASPGMMKDTLRVYASSNCGDYWSLIDKVGGSGLVTSAPSPNTTADFYPVQSSEWKTRAVPIAPGLYTAHTRFKFEYTSSGSGNNIFMDNINLSGVVGISETTNIQSFEIYPNPNDGRSLHVSLKTTSPEATTLMITDYTGREVMMKQVPASESDLILNESELPEARGVYFVQVRGNNTFACKKLVIQ